MNTDCKCGGSDHQTTIQLPELQEILTRFHPNRREYLIPILQETQGAYGYLSKPAMIKVAQHVGVAVSKVYGVATFYNQFKLTAPGKHVIQICRGTACHVRGSDQILRAFESELSIKAGQTTKDQEFSLDIVACIGSCSIAPVITADGEFHGRLTTKDVVRILENVRNGGTKK